LTPFPFQFFPVNADCKSVNVLIIEADAALGEAIAADVRSLGHDARVAASNADALGDLDLPPIDVLILDSSLTAAETDVLRRAAGGRGAQAHTIVVGVIESRDTAPLDLAGGADDYLLAPIAKIELWARLENAARTLGARRRLVEREEELHRVTAELLDQSRLDPLTGIGNILRMEEDVDALHSRVHRYGGSYCVAICDIDYFKSYNDASGRMFGDEVLKTVSQTLAAACRSSDSIYRYGGGQLLLLLPEQTLSGAVRALGRMRRSIEELKMTHGGTAPPSVVTISAGLASFKSDEDLEVDDILRRAQAALDVAKRHGANNVVAADGATVAAR